MGRIKDKFIELGYTEADISGIQDFPSVSQPTQLTTRGAWLQQMILEFLIYSNSLE
jgi:hypothetical protein